MMRAAAHTAPPTRASRGSPSRIIHPRSGLELDSDEGLPACTLPSPRGNGRELGVSELGALVAVVVDALLVFVCAGVGRVPMSAAAWPGCPPGGVGSNAVHPSPASQTSGQACASRARTRNFFDCGSYSPGAKPTATRAGSPTARAIAA